MELEEAKRRLKRVITTSTIMKLENSMESYADLEYIKNANSLEIILQELDRLQKENEELKNKIKDCLDDIEDYFENVSVPYDDIEFIKEKRKDLLKEE